MTDERIKVKSYSGYRADETPRSFVLHSEEIKIIEIVDLWIEEGPRDRGRRRFFKVRGSDGLVHQLFFNEETQEWFIRKRADEIS